MEKLGDFNFFRTGLKSESGTYFGSCPAVCLAFVKNWYCWYCSREIALVLPLSLFICPVSEPLYHPHLCRLKLILITPATSASPSTAVRAFP
jgi:hypothetical protein